MKRIKLFAFCAFFFIISSNCFGSHILGADMSYRHLSGNDYLFTLTLFRDCAGITLPQGQSVDVASSCGTSTHSLSLFDSTEVTPLCMTQNSTCNGGAWPGVEVMIYTGQITLTPCSDWRISWRMCCRNSAPVNITNPGSHSLYTEVLLNNVNGPNNAPTFMEYPAPYLCDMGGYCINNTAYDFDGDSLVYSIVSVRDDSNSTIPYQAPYTPTQPFNGAGTFNPANGNICLGPVNSGSYVFAIRVDEYRNGQWVGSIYRDAQASAFNCTPPQSMDISGNVTDSQGAPASNAKVILYKYDINQGSMPKLDSTMTNASGNYAITTNVYGQYMVKAFPDTSINSGTLPSYHMGSFYWNTGQVIFTVCDSAATADIQLADQNNPVGIGVVSGYLYGYGLLRGGGAQGQQDFYVYVIDKSTGDQVAHDVTDANGYYEISSLEPGNYEILIDVPGLIHTSTHLFTITGSENFSGMDFLGTDNGIHAIQNTNGIADTEEVRIKIYPNPASEELYLEGLNDQSNYLIYSMMGKVVSQGTIRNNSIDVSSFTNGTYFLQVDASLPVKFVVAR